MSISGALAMIKTFAYYPLSCKFLVRVNTARVGYFGFFIPKAVNILQFNFRSCSDKTKNQVFQKQFSTY
jgi:hypothetical protein